MPDEEKALTIFEAVGDSRKINVECPICHKTRQMSKSKYELKKLHGVCLKCYTSQRGELHSTWKGGKTKNAGGYVRVKLQPSDFFFPMADCANYVFEHRLVVAQSLGRCLHQWEIVHHKKGYAKDDNRYPETLQLVTSDKHNQYTIMETKVAKLTRKLIGLQSQVKEQNSQIRLLQWQVKQLNKERNYV